jgi:hypothetical protein
MRFTLTLLSALFLTGCDLLGLGGPGETVVEGIVVSAETGEPVGDVDVVLASSCAWSYCTPLDGMRTGPSGEFRVAYETERDGSSLLLIVNYVNCPEGWHCTYPYRWNPEWVSFQEGIRRGQEERDFRIELRPAP